MIDALISRVTQELGLSAPKAEGGIGVLFALMEKFGDNGAVGALLDKLPGARELVGKYIGQVDGDAAGGLGGALGGGLAGMVGGLLGGKAGDAMKALSAMKAVGLDMDDAKKLVPVVADFARSNAGEEIFKNAAKSVPFLKELLG